jgi:hypothetical protein
MMAESMRELRKRKANPDIGLDAEQPGKKKQKKAWRTWEESFRALVAYKEQHGDCDVPRIYRGGRGLGRWVGNQRRMRNTKLTQEQRDRLDELGFNWEIGSGKSKDRYWDEMFQRLKAYQRENPECRVSLINNQDPELARWVERQRAEHSRGKMRHDRKAKLESIHFMWSMKTQKRQSSSRPTPTDDEKWSENYTKLVEFSKEHGFVPIHYGKDNCFGKWVHHIRQLHSQNRLCDDRKKLLDELRFVWTVNNGLDAEPPRKKMQKRRWEESFRALVAYKEQHGDCDVPRIYPEGQGLGQWVGVQRRYRVTKLTQEQRDRLDELGFNWETKKEREDRQWDERFQRLKAFLDLDCRVSQVNKQDSKLARWAEKQRKEYSEGILPHDRQAKLESIHFTWGQKKQSHKPNDKSDDLWFERYTKLVNFSKEHGHCIVPIHYAKDKALGLWVHQQRTYNRQNRLREDRKKLLDELKFVWRVEFADADASLTQRKWDKMFERLVEFKQTYGHVMVPKDFPIKGLARWVCVQRFMGRNRDKIRELDPRRARRLFEIGVDFDFGWEDNFEKLKAYKEKNGHCRVVTTGLEDVQGLRFAAWVRNQRTFLEKGILLSERKAKLDAIGFVWQAPNVNNIGEDKEDGVAEPERGDLQIVGLDDDEQNESKAVGNVGGGCGESDSSDDEFQFEG